MCVYIILKLMIKMLKVSRYYFYNYNKKPNLISSKIAVDKFTGYFFAIFG